MEARLASMGRGMLLLFWLAVGALLTWGFQVWLDGEANPNRDPRSERVDGRVMVTLQRNRQNHYVAGGTINGSPVTFLLDTGATDVAVPGDVAARLGLRRGPESRALTANGTTTVYLTRIDTLQLGGIVLRDVRASVLPAMDGEEILLGMSALGQVDWAQRGDTLTLTF